MDAHALKAMKRVFDEVEKRDPGAQSANECGFCGDCGRQVRLLTILEVEGLFITDAPGVARLAELGEIHWIMNSKGEPRICSGFARRAGRTQNKE